jgi:hypothetical protein
MPEVLVATPLDYFKVSKPYQFAGGVEIREISAILWEEAIVQRFISEYEREGLAETTYWLCATKEVPIAFADESDGLYDACRRAMYALQIICPSGGRNVYLKFQRTPNGYANMDSQHPKKMNNTLLGRLASAEDQGLAQDFDRVYAGVKRAFEEKLVRLQNPVLLLEHALQIGTVELGTLMSVMALDMLFMAGEKQPFVKRLGGFLGPQSRVFPRTSILRNRPIVQVEEVLSHLYEFRNVIAHGQEVPSEPYRQKYDLKDDRDGRINAEDYYHAELMLEAGIFMLAQALRQVFVEDLFDDISDQTAWRSKLRLYENRYRSAATL